MSASNGRNNSMGVEESRFAWPAVFMTAGCRVALSLMTTATPTSSDMRRFAAGITTGCRSHASVPRSRYPWQTATFSPGRGGPRRPERSLADDNGCPTRPRTLGKPGITPVRCTAFCPNASITGTEGGSFRSVASLGRRNTALTITDENILPRERDQSLAASGLTTGVRQQGSVGKLGAARADGFLLVGQRSNPDSVTRMLGCSILRTKTSEHASRRLAAGCAISGSINSIGAGTTLHPTAAGGMASGRCDDRNSLHRAMLPSRVDQTTRIRRRVGPRTLPIPQMRREGGPAATPTT